MLRFRVLLSVVLFLFCCRLIPAQEPKDKDCAAGQEQKADATDGAVKFLTFEGMHYPPLAATARISGKVTLRVTLADDGAVASASVVSGHPMLVQEALSNVRKWRFKPASAKEATMVYDFQLGKNACPQGLRVSSFAFELPNLVTITTCAPMVNP